MSLRADVVVIGAGVIGSSIALELARAGRAGRGRRQGRRHRPRVDQRLQRDRAVQLLDLVGRRAGVGVAARLALLGRAPGHEDPDGLARLEQTGMVVLGAGDASYDGTTALFDRAGVPWERWDASDLARHLPAPRHRLVRPAQAGRLRGVLRRRHRHHQRALHPGRRLRRPTRSSPPTTSAPPREAYGARYLLHRLVTADRPHRQRLAGHPRLRRRPPRTGRRERRRPLVGPRQRARRRRPRLRRDHAPAAPGGPPRLRSPRLQRRGPASRSPTSTSAPTPAPPRATASSSAAPNPSATPSTGSTTPTPPGERPTLPVYDRPGHPRRPPLPDLTVPTQPRGIVGVYDVTSDWTPIYDRTAEPGFYVAMGTSGNQFKNAPAVGTLMRALDRRRRVGTRPRHRPGRRHRPPHRPPDRPRHVLAPARGAHRRAVVGDGLREPPFGHRPRDTSPIRRGYTVPADMRSTAWMQGAMRDSRTAGEPWSAL